MKICIGTANFNREYGLHQKKLTYLQKNKVLNQLIKKNINFLDTANGYKNDSFLKQNKEFNIITKLSTLRYFSISKLEKEIQLQIQNLIKYKPLYAVLIHDCKDMFSKKNLEIYKCLLNLKKRKMVKKIGISCYHEADLKILKKFNFDIVQFPLNLFDQIILKKENIKIIKNKEIHVRSIFLKGLLLEDKDKINKYFSKWSVNLENYYKFLRKNKITNLECCIRFVKQQKFISKIIIGIENVHHLNQTLRAFKKKYKNKLNFKNLKSNDEGLFLPINWRLN